MSRTLTALTVITVLTTAHSLTAQNQQLPPHPGTPPHPSWVTNTTPRNFIFSAHQLPYQLITGQPPSARSGHTAIWTGTEMIIWGGYNGRGILNSGGRYNPTTREWTTTTTNGTPTGRTSHTAVWTGSDMIIWGGAGGIHSYWNEGWRYSPVTDRWTPITTNGTPSPRAAHSAIWTGREMIVWGGHGDLPAGYYLESGDLYLNSGGRYNPSTDSWTPVTSTRAPEGRSYPTAAWTGSDMIIWGGGSSSRNILGGGWRYSPVTDRWTPITTNGAPSSRYAHSAIWTGKEMIVWGGHGDPAAGYYLNSGGRYNPSTDSWAPITTSGAPVARERHTAIWTGSDMIIWGGRGHLDLSKLSPRVVHNVPDSSDLNSGGRYDPTTDSWKPITAKDVPAEREAHTAIWTGKEMIIWGGHVVGGLNDGGRYNPDTDTWIPIPANEEEILVPDHESPKK